MCSGVSVEGDMLVLEVAAGILLALTIWGLLAGQ
jgi:hypothetical protein